ncbi:MAG: 3-hydroxyacyl-CoA dehydrogenase family protein [Chloroflexi bacterium]|nr:3-hydroxyacyl-CoA dehydrogenase family protein [Chloroflexota bacterium]
MKLEDIGKVVVVGAGTMGPGIAQIFAQASYQVTVQDLSGEALERALDTIKSGLKVFVDNGILTMEKADEGLSRVETTLDLAKAAKDADFVVEAIYEDLEVKKEIFQELDELCPSHTILASSLSTLPIDAMAEATKRPDKVILTHFANPPNIIPVVEVARGAKTSDETTDITLGLLRKVGKKPIVCLKAIPGYLVNTFNAAIISAALDLLATGIATKEDIDTVFTANLGPRLSVIGPFKVMDMFGLDLIWQIVSSGAMPGLGDPRVASIKELVDAGHFGVKTGKGFYDYSPKSPDEIRREINESLFTAFKAMLKETQ